MALGQDLAPLAHGPQDEHGDHGRADGGDDRPDERTDRRRSRAVALALEVDEAVADQPADTGRR